MEFSKTLIKWYLQNKRDLPWRGHSDPYPIWLSEIILQQTRVAQGLPYFNAFMAAFPTVADLASADEQTVLKHWQGLGYYSRARNLHKTAQTVAFELGGTFPGSHEGLLKLKGIGDYTAAAIASFSYNEKVPVVDGNVFRVLARYFGIESDIAIPSTRKIFRELAFSLMPDHDPALFNQAIMEFGALQCVPKSPDCSVCPFNDSCVALQKRMVDRLPVKEKKVKVTTRFLNYIVPFDTVGRTFIRKRIEKGIWHNLYEFPLIETGKPAENQEIGTLLKDKNILPGFENLVEFEQQRVIHKLTHQQLHIRFWRADTEILPGNGITIEELAAFPFPIVIHNFIMALPAS